jgi:hypothetical protein
MVVCATLLPPFSLICKKRWFSSAARDRSARPPFSNVCTILKITAVIAASFAIPATRKAGRWIFAVIKDGVLEELIEVKYSDEELSPALRYFNERLHPAKATQIVATLDKPYDRGGIRITSPFRYFADNTPWASE